MCDKQTESNSTWQKYQHNKWEYEQNTTTAERAHDAEAEFGLRINEAAINNSNLALRALLIINGGAAIALLAFIGNLVPVAPSVYANLPKVIPSITSLMWFALGVAVTVFGMAFAYFTNYFYTGASAKRTRSYEHPYIQETQISHKWVKLGLTFHSLAVIFALIAIVSFMLGVYEVNEMIKAFLKAAPTQPAFH